MSLMCWPTSGIETRTDCGQFERTCLTHAARLASGGRQCWRVRFDVVSEYGANHSTTRPLFERLALDVPIFGAVPTEKSICGAGSHPLAVAREAVQPQIDMRSRPGDVRRPGHRHHEGG